MLGQRRITWSNHAISAKRLPAWLGRLCAVVLILVASGLFQSALMPVAAQDGKLQKAGHLVGHGGPIRALAVDQRRERVLSGSFDYAMMLWQLDEAGVASNVRRFSDHDGAVSAVAFHPDGARALSGSDDGALHVWDLTNAKQLQLFKGHGAKIVGLALSPNETTVATASWDRTVRLWDLSSGKPLHVLRGHTGPVNAVAFSSDGSLLLSAAYDGTLRLWSVVTGEPKRIAYRHGWGINVLQRFGATDQFLFGALDGTSAIYDLGTNTIVAKLKTHEKPVLSLAVLDQPGLIATGGGDGEIYVYRQGDWKLLESYRNPYGPVWAMAFADRGARLYFGSLDDFATAWQISPRKPFERVATKFPRRFQVNQNVSLGERQFARKCSICHTLKPDDANRAGPTLYKIFGRRAGSLPGYPYSKALKSIDVVWTAETIDKLFRLGPHDYTPGSKMPLQRIAEKAKRDALIEFLQAATQPESAN